MYYYRTTEYLCLCGDTRRDPGTKLPKAMDSSRWRLPDLYFCPTCLVLKCRNCCVATVECKYCASCMADYTDARGVTRCQKNCFQCPECTAPLSVAVEDCAQPVRGKRFGFRCGACDYAYQTRVVTKPAPLAAIVRAEEESEYTQLAAMWSEKRRGVGASLDKAAEARMRRMGLGPKSSSESSAAAMAAKPAASRRARLPLSAHLAAKRAYSCDACRTPLVVPSRDPHLMKLAHKHFAVDTVPTVAARTRDGAVFQPHTETACVLSVVNPLASSITVTASIVLQNPYGAAVALPVTCFSIQGHRAGPPQSVPTPYLTAVTSRARAEQLERAVRRGATAALDVGPNWTTVPFAVTVERGARATVPFYFTVEEVERGAKYGFWALLHVEDGPV